MIYLYRNKGKTRKESELKMNEKGFTLVELLAVIAILAILVVIAMPNVLGMYNDARKNTFATEAQNILKQAATDFIADSLGEYSPTTVYTTETVKIDDSGAISATGTEIGVNPLNLEGTKSYTLILDSQGNVITAKIWDNTFCYYVTKADGIKYTEMNSANITEGACEDVPKTL